jgi:hypothetical protein
MLRRDRVDGVGHLLHALAALLRAGNRRLDERRGISRRLRGALRQAAHLVGHDREAHARLAGARRFDAALSAGCWSGTRSRRSS